MNLEIQRLITLLRMTIRILGMTHREVERKLGKSQGYLSRLFSGRIELKAGHLIQIPRAIGVEPEEFFKLAYPTRSKLSHPAAPEIQDLLWDLRPLRETPPDQELEKKILAVLRKLAEEEND
jgi:transcriptional regulator with XRE-family HTH domain